MKIRRKKDGEEIYVDKKVLGAWITWCEEESIMETYDEKYWEEVPEETWEDVTENADDFLYYVTTVSENSRIRKDKGWVKVSELWIEELKNKAARHDRATIWPSDVLKNLGEPRPVLLVERRKE